MVHEYRSRQATQPARRRLLVKTVEKSGYQQMEKALWYVFVGSRGGANRIWIVRELKSRPRNANELASRLEVDYNTITHHLDVLVEHNVAEPGDNDYGQLYFLTDQFEHHWATFETISAEVE